MEIGMEYFKCTLLASPGSGVPEESMTDRGLPGPQEPGAANILCGIIIFSNCKLAFFTSVIPKFPNFHHKPIVSLHCRSHIVKKKKKDHTYLILYCKKTFS